jgi:hypothetical protein
MSKHKKKYKGKIHSRPVAINGMVSLSPVALVVGIIGSIVFLIFAILSFKESSATAVIFGLFALLGISLIVAYINCRIYYESDEFTHKNFFGVKHTYKYSEITGIQRGASDTTIYVGKKKILVDSISDSDDFLRLVDLRVGKSIKKVKSKLFNDNIHNPEEFIFAYSIVPIFVIGTMIALNIIGKPLTLDNLDCITTTITSYQEYTSDSGDINLSLTLDGYSPEFVVYYYQEDMQNFSQFESAVSNGVDFNIYFDNSVEDVESTGASIYMLTDSNGNTYLTLEATSARDAETLKWINIVFLVVLLLSIGFAVVAFYVMSHADKFPRAVKLFVKDSYIKH